jgi:ketosteroid isomerase-like protein
MGDTPAAELLRRYYREVWVEGNVAVLDELLAADYHDHDPPPGYGSDRESARRLAAAFVAGLRDPELEILALVADARTASAHWRLDWTQNGPLFGDPAADGKRLSLRGADLVEVRGGRIAAIYHVESLLALTRRLSG